MKKKLFFLSAAIVFALDRLTKVMWAESDFTLIPRILAVRGTQNTGMAFGLFSGGALILAAVSVVILLLLFRYMKTHPLSRFEQLGLGLIAGGALGNLLDRVVYGHVIDMLEPLFMQLFVFNIADAGITTGAVILGAAILFGKEAANDGTA